MTETHISPDDIDGLAETLDGLQLPTGQRALLSAIVTVATAAVANHGRPHVGQPIVAELSDPVPSFHDQFDTAFKPGLDEALKPPLVSLHPGQPGGDFKVGHFP